MTHVVTENCDGCRFTDCVHACPVACFHGDELRVYIDPVACIDCGACIPACPVHAIFEEFDLTEEQQPWVALNADRAAELPVIWSRETALPTAQARRQELGY
ncbi:MAG: ferredoxin family protein [Burkholderiales bacterium]